MKYYQCNRVSECSMQLPSRGDTEVRTNGTAHSLRPRPCPTSALRELLDKLRRPQRNLFKIQGRARLPLLKTFPGLQTSTWVKAKSLTMASGTPHLWCHPHTPRSSAPDWPRALLKSFMLVPASGFCPPPNFYIAHFLLSCVSSVPLSTRSSPTTCTRQCTPLTLSTTLLRFFFFAQTTATWQFISLFSCLYLYLILPR